VCAPVFNRPPSQNRIKNRPCSTASVLLELPVCDVIPGESRDRSPWPPTKGSVGATWLNAACRGRAGKQDRTAEPRRTAVAASQALRKIRSRRSGESAPYYAADKAVSSFRSGGALADRSPPRPARKVLRSMVPPSGLATPLKPLGKKKYRFQPQLGIPAERLECWRTATRVKSVPVKPPGGMPGGDGLFGRWLSQWRGRIAGAAGRRPPACRPRRPVWRVFDRCHSLLAPVLPVTPTQYS